LGFALPELVCRAPKATQVSHTVAWDRIGRSVGARTVNVVEVIDRCLDAAASVLRSLWPTTSRWWPGPSPTGPDPGAASPAGHARMAPDAEPPVEHVRQRRRPPGPLAAPGR